MLFDVKGWDLKLDKVKFGGDENSKKKKAKKEKRARQETDTFGGQDSKDDFSKSKKAKRDVKQDNGKIDNKDVKLTKNKSNNEDSKKQLKTNAKVSAAPTEPAPAPAPFASSSAKLTPLQQKMMAKLSGSRFRWINEQLYTTTSESALKLIKDQPVLFDEYHEGFRSQVQSWPENPVDVFVDQIKERVKTRRVNAPGGLPGLGMDKKVIIADMGCGEAMLALKTNDFISKYNKKINPKKRVNLAVHSFDLKKGNERITVADIKNVPLPDESCTVVVFCLALMGTNFLDFITEAYRILAPRGELWIAEIKSRFSENNEKVGDEFVETLKLMGFFHKKTDNENKMFTRFEFFKPPQDILRERQEKLERRKKFVEVELEKEKLLEKREKLAEGNWLLKPCIYKRR